MRTVLYRISIVIGTKRIERDDSLLTDINVEPLPKSSLVYDIVYVSSLPFDLPN